MKITPTDYTRLKTAILEFLNKDDRILTADVSFVNDIDKARRWTIFHQVNRPGKNGFPFRLDYLNDAHIDTALRNIIREYKEA
jgi:hypothetical protein